MALAAGIVEPESTSLDAPCPCDSCPRAARCAEQQLACVAFQYYTAGASEPRWRGAPRAPTHDLWVRLFAVDKRLERLPSQRPAPDAGN